jgi:hypothetical protein
MDTVKYRTRIFWLCFASLFNFILFSFLFVLFLKIYFFISNRNKFLCFASKQKGILILFHFVFASTEIERRTLLLSEKFTKIHQQNLTLYLQQNEDRIRISSEWLVIKNQLTSPNSFLSFFLLLTSTPILSTPFVELSPFSGSKLNEGWGKKGLDSEERNLPLNSYGWTGGV